MEQQVRPNVQTFTSAEFGELRTQVAEDGKIFFCLTDVARALDIANSPQLAQRLKSRGICSIYTPAKNQHEAEVMQQMTFIDEPNLYRCIFQSRKKEAEVFQSWVFEDLLPTIRKTGGYIATAEQDTPEMIMAKALQVAAETIKKHQEKLEAKAVELEKAEKVIDEQYEQLEEMDAELDAIRPMAEYAEKVLASHSTMNITLIAAEIGMSAVSLNKGLAAMGIQRKVGNQWVLLTRFLNKGYEDVLTTFLPNGETKTRTVWTQKGRAFILLLTRAVRLEGQDPKKAIPNVERIVAQMTDEQLGAVNFDRDKHPHLSHPQII